MTVVRPTLEVLKTLDKKGLLPRELSEGLKYARGLEDPAAKVRHLASLGLSTVDIPLCHDARTLFESANPSRQNAMSDKAGKPVFEARDRSGAAYRGAVLGPQDGVAWIVHVDPHDSFHRSGPTTIAAMNAAGSLGPSALDLRILRIEQSEWNLRADRAALLEALLDAIADTARSSDEARLEGRGDFEDIRLSVQIPARLEPDWEVATAHEEVGGLAVRLRLTGEVSREVRDDALRTVVPFLQPDESMREEFYRHDLVVQMLVTRARLIQLLASQRPVEPVESRTPPRPCVLHYTAKSSLAKAYVEGRAVRAVCGVWWVPVGDESTHAELPVCSDCETAEPFAQKARTILLRKLSDRA